MLNNIGDTTVQLPRCCTFLNTSFWYTPTGRTGTTAKQSPSLTAYNCGRLKIKAIQKSRRSREVRRIKPKYNSLISPYTWCRSWKEFVCTAQTVSSPKSKWIFDNQPCLQKKWRKLLRTFSDSSLPTRTSWWGDAAQNIKVSCEEMHWGWGGGEGSPFCYLFWKKSTRKCLFTITS